MKTIYNLTPISPVNSGDVYRATCNISTRGGYNLYTGELLQVHDKTEEAPHDEMSESGVNWICRTKHGISIWATLEHCISRGLFIRVPPVTEG